MDLTLDLVATLLEEEDEEEILAGQHKDKEKKPTKVLEAVADYDLRIWHYNFGSPGSLNDLNILDQSSIFDRFLRGEALNVEYTINDGIYPEWSVFAKTIEKPLGNKRSLARS
ncbi:hypothetical protein PF002_g21316 [Phytophthora fragariae]|uniref:DDE Tnp4 domain-containing protein n=1 Tax=Phytophthora fragariae TaxID=53985 RepID=A0A6A3XGB2_9STRA|nr:hypothetical protein PF009_g21462 [Phytophthora fragariae]KAE9088622.1 hypothetical protein PF007_g19908 [Phytophthora fragariae]KAE9202189.1 hypothetical protein PF002_g21316 [Phytophthora fragariae]KAE9290893.1 hypothetical protein PF001_g19408 [Phytophthora fragariae]